MKETTLGRILKEMYESAFEGDQVANIHLFGIYYADVIKNEGLNRKEILKVAELLTSYHTEISKGIRLARYVNISKEQSDRIIAIQKNVC